MLNKCNDEDRHRDHILAHRSPAAQTTFLAGPFAARRSVSSPARGAARHGPHVVTWISLFIPRGFLSASSSPAAALSTVHMPPPLRSSFPEGAANPAGELRRGVQGRARSITPPPVSLWFLPAPPASPDPLLGAQVGRGAAGRQPGLGSRQGVHVARRPAGGTGGDRCHGGPDLFLQEECKELIVSLPGMDLSLALPRLVERTPGLVHVE